MLMLDFSASTQAQLSHIVRRGLVYIVLWLMFFVAVHDAIANEPKEVGELSHRDREILELMQTDGVRSWTRIRSQAMSATFKGVDVRNWFTETEVTPEKITNWLLKTQGDNLVLELEDVSQLQDTRSLPKRSVVGVNGRYTFHLARKNADSDWNVSRLEVYAEPQGQLAGMRSFTESQRRQQAKIAALHYLVYVNCSTAIGLIPLPSLVVDPGFSLLNTRPVPGHKGLTEVEFSYLPTDGSYESFLPTPTPLRGGTMVLDHEHGWIIDSYRVQLTQSFGENELFTATIKYSSKGNAESMPLPQTLAITQGDPNDPPRFQIARSIQFDEIAFEKVTDEAFELTAYGLPAPGDIEPAPRRFWLIAFNIGLILFFVAIFLYRRSKRSAASR